ncbi:phospholipase D family protein [Actinopolymorpha pittospori]
MLPPDYRSVLIDALRPPPGAIFDRAVALTFTLDLESALVVPLAFGAHAARETKDPLAIMEAVRGCADRVDVFCQAGQVKVPKSGSDLLAFLEPMIHPVHRPRSGLLYHPKLWAVRYWDPTEECYLARLLVLSRNLTDDRSWDVCLRLDGVVRSRPVGANRALFELLRHSVDLAVSRLPAKRREGVLSLAEDLRRVEWEFPDGVNEIAFHAIGVPGWRPPDFTGTRCLVVSPFCNAPGLEIAADSREVAVVGRQEELDRLPDATLEGVDAYVLSELAGLPPDEVSETGEEQGLLTGLHAKLYVVEHGHTARVLLGSANATGAAFTGNVEFLVELVGSRKQLGIETMLGDGADFRSILEPYNRQSAVEMDDDQRMLDNLLRALAGIPLTATVEPDQHDDGTRRLGRLRIRLTSDVPAPAAEEVRFTAELLTRRGEAAELALGVPVDASFADLAVFDVTPFLIITAQDDHSGRATTVVHAQLVGDPADRLDQVLARQIDTPEKFLRFLALLLGLGADQTMLAAADGDARSGTWVTTGGPGILELLMRALVDRPKQLDDLGRLVDQLRSTDVGDALLPEGFNDVWDAVAAVRRDMVLEDAG